MLMEDCYGVIRVYIMLLMEMLCLDGWQLWLSVSPCSIPGHYQDL